MERQRNKDSTNVEVIGAISLLISKMLRLKSKQIDTDTKEKTQIF
jgi:hypothetical protein